MSPSDTFARRHISPSEAEIAEMLAALGYASLDELAAATVPAAIRLAKPLALGEPLGEFELIEELKNLAADNQVLRSFIGQGYYDTITPPVILRNILENPGFYTAYTPYQAEISQGRLEALVNFQTMVQDLTGLPMANASLLDEGTAAAEAMMMAYEAAGRARTTFWVDAATHPQTIAVMRTRAVPLGVDLRVAPPAQWDAAPMCGALLSYPSTDGRVEDHKDSIAKIHAAQGIVVMATDLLALTLLTPPGELGADIAIGSAQRFGVPMGFGGPHAACRSCKDELRRPLPGRLIGVSRDAKGKVAFRLALQTREQHIRREKATSNICTAQVLLAVMASMYAVYHGPEGLTRIAARVRGYTALIAAGLAKLGAPARAGTYFDTLRIDLDAHRAAQVLARATERGLNLRRYDDGVGLSCDETTNLGDVHALLESFCDAPELPFEVADLVKATAVPALPAGLQRTSAFLTHATFSRYHAEHELLRYLNRLQAKDLSLTTSMIPLGSCTMKLNATTEMIPVTWPEFGRIHPFAPAGQWGGYKAMFEQLEAWLAEITGFAAVSLQPNSGAQGEYAGLLAIRGYFDAKGETHRRVCLIPQSAHGTNPASAVLAGMQVVVVASNPDGTIDLGDLKKKAEAHAANLAAIMVTYPSTHGVFEEGIKEVCSIVHANGGQVYMDGANMNAQVGLSRPGDIGADVCHLNLHKTFCLAAGTRVALPGGVSRPIEHMLSTSSVYGWSDEDKGVRPARLAAMVRTGKKACVQITLQDGRTITCTPDHRVLTTQGWVEAAQLTPKHRVVMGPDLPADDCNVDVDAEAAFRPNYGGLALGMGTAIDRERTLAFFRLLGMTCSDGTYSQSEERGRIRERVRLYFGTRLDAERAVADVALLTGARPAISNTNLVFSINLPNELVVAIAAFPGMGEPGRKMLSGRTIPDVIVHPDTPLAILREFLGALFGGDGCAPTVLHLVKAPPTMKMVRFAQTHSDPALLAVAQQQICAVLKRLGVEATPDPITRTSPTALANKAGEDRWSGPITVVDSLAFAERVGFRYCSHKSARLSAAAAYWRLKRTVNAQRIDVAKRALASVSASGFAVRGPKPVWSTAVVGAYQEVAAAGPILSPYYASFAGTKHVSKQVLTNAVRGQKETAPGVRRTNRRVLAAAIGRGGAVTGVPALMDFLAEIGASTWFNKQPSGDGYKVTYATSREAVVEPTFHLGVVDVRPAGEHVVYDLTVDKLHSFVANGAVVHNCIPHGGGGPGMGPIGVAAHLAPYLPGHPLAAAGSQPVGPVSAAPWGSASILPISFAYIAMMGEPGLKKATQVAILNANYIAHRLGGHYPVLYTGQNGRVAHELIVDCRGFKKSAGIEAEDIAKRLMDYGFHAPTMSFPVPGTLMIEPTESESKGELDRFCEALISIRAEIAAIESGQMDRANNPLKNAPHTAAEVTGTEWNHPYPREQAAYPAPWLRVHKYWPPVSRVDNAYGDRNLVCACPPIEAYS
ncbi:MAG: aminomethyl-transferring glycine dehydrogenase [Myxococcales bacterium]|nr:aminomethyl-transferring glycine dehydrogenase [Myxococcales bacterium]